MHGTVADEMAFVSLWLSLGLIFLDLEWRNKTVDAMPSYEGICKLVHRAVDCNGKQLSSVPEDLPANTQELFMDANFVRILRKSSMQRYSDLWSLSLGENNLESIESGAFSSNRKLEVLSLQDNSIFVNCPVTAVALQSLPALKKLDLSGNYLTEDMVGTLLQNLSSLESLSLARNIIMRLDSTVFESLGQLRELNLESNYIYEIEDGAFENSWRLQRLNLAYNHIPCIVNFDLTKLQVLNASYNSIEWFLTEESNADFELETLDLSHNQLLFFPLLPKLSKLRSLLLSDNEMNFYANISNATTSKDGLVKFIFISNNVTNVTSVNLWEEVILGNFSSLNFLDMSRNQFRYLPDGFLAGMTSLLHLKLNQNCFQIINLSERELPATLTELDVSQNQLLELQVDPFSKSILPNLQFFNLSANRLKRMPSEIFAQLNSITTVDLSHIQLSLCPKQNKAGRVGDGICVDFRNVTSLRYLYLSGCDLEPVSDHAFKGTSLIQLDLSNNKKVLSRGMRPLQVLALSLQSLSLRNIDLSTSAAVDFSKFQKLVALDLSGNSLTSFPSSLNNLALRTLDLRKNHISFLPQLIAQQRLGKNLHVIYLSQNPYDCCKLDWLNSLQGLMTVHIADRALITCNFSSNTVSVVELPKSVIQSCLWMTADTTLLYLVLILPTSLTLLVAFIILFLMVKQKLFKMVKSRWRGSSNY
ncbi:transforming growth factor beta activator LRRC33 isoform X2 [Rhinatrema bivittatum]|uniref:transforming growth factor beta activator LRRC33 isoform X2 n=1 Tax=Rhinatrema bivittatum TaxID=194408 RepID=UPI00112C348C|nr:transforming growth factor beta activator LRRC33 isoform X2 [Rhinatrema bivittatum]XP_029472368.1 transforming growth factor beta activator LRRC33 isoform X2 [Rhinatrema bivittatum]XP_029472369.1 transforming growth factor beta activator LRRC33 isoform X2 [Rhinatrema bivittatum]